MKNQIGKRTLDVSQTNTKVVKWMLVMGTSIAVFVALYAMFFAINLGYAIFALAFLLNAILFPIVGILSYLYFSSREIILYENGMKIPYTRFSSKYINYNKIKSIHPYARGGAVRIEANGVSLKIPKGYIERWDEFIEFVRNKGLINEKEEVKT